jgi:hypothetical protein
MVQQPVQLSAGDLVYDASVQITKIIDYGVKLEEALGRTELPPAGVRFDVEFEGTSSGPLSGTVHGVDYLYIRPDGRLELHIHAVITAKDGERVAIHAPGVGTVNADGTAGFTEYVTAHTSFEQYAWLNQTALRGTGLVNLATGSISVQTYVA